MKQVTLLITMLLGCAVLSVGLWYGLRKPPCLLIVDNHKIAGSDLEKYLKSRNVSYVVVDQFSKLEHVAELPFKGVILTGGPLCYTSKKIDIESINIDSAVLLHFTCPILGICFGHQTIVELFGGKICRLKELCKGMQKVRLLKKGDLFQGLGDEVAFNENHYDCCTELPYNFELIATSDVCFMEGVKHTTRPIFGVQFHPEKSGEHGYRLLDNFLRLCGCEFEGQ